MQGECRAAAALSRVLWRARAGARFKSSFIVTAPTAYIRNVTNHRYYRTFAAGARVGTGILCNTKMGIPFEKRLLAGVLRQYKSAPFGADLRCLFLLLVLTGKGLFV